ncbi:Deoxyribodipyrimidine photo-lyase type II [Planctomycetales bacterium 10988]|nr:Deoxyribodipyrimidine photo-lyase type II [Planctomycetales bacterium 10988]
MKSFPELRLTDVNVAPINQDGDFVLYWMIAFRRTKWNYSLQRAVDWAKELKKPLVILEALRCNYRWASDRIHRFVMQGMAVNQEELQDKPCLYYPYIEPEQLAGKGLVEKLSEKACVVVTDDFPCFFLPTMVRLVGRRIDVRMEKIDSNGLLPLRATDRVFTKAHSFRRHLQKELPLYLEEAPRHHPLSRIQLPTLKKLPKSITDRWPPATKKLLSASSSVLSDLPIDHSVGPGAINGGSNEAEKTWKDFLNKLLKHYHDKRNEVEDRHSSGLSPYLHFGHISPHQIFYDLANQEDWNTRDLSEETKGSREGWWGMSQGAEAFLDEIITWREIGYNCTSHTKDYDKYESLPDWAKQSLKKHEKDSRPYLYSFEEWEEAKTHDDIWNAAQTELVRDGKLHNYLRMFWGKKVLHWSERPQEALETLIELNNKYALDGRNPNSYSGIFWVFGRYDRAWGPERQVFGKIRYMSSDSTRRKLKLTKYLEKYAPEKD